MQSIGERLEEARKRKGLSIREAAEATKIRGDYLHKFESNQFDIRLPEIYVRGFLRSYANYLKVPAEKIVNDYNGLGLGENKAPRALNREVYGRMDLSVGSSKPEKDPKEQAEPAPGTPTPAPQEVGAHNPATFVPPRSASGNPIDRALLIKAGMLVAATVVVVLLVVWMFSGRSDKSGGPSAAATTDAIWVRPTAGEPTMTLVSTGPVSVTVTSRSDNTTLYQGTIPRGDVRAVPRRGALRVTADPYQNLEFEIGGKRWPMPNQRTAEILPP